MKRFLFCILSLLGLQTAKAQLILNGMSYTQNFNGIGGGLPIGWEVDSAATATFKGYPAIFTPAPATWSSGTGGFRNYAAKGNYGSFSAVTPAQQMANPNRALGVRQVAATDPGVAFILQIANTTGLSGFNLSTKLLSLDSGASRVSTWRVDYAFGINPTIWTKAAVQAGDSTTGGNTFSDSTLTASFGAALDNQAGPVWIRIVTLTATTGNNNRPSSAIDDFSLNWTGNAPGPLRPLQVSLSPAPGATNIPINSNLTIVFNRNIDTGTGFIHVRDQTMGMTQDIASIPANVIISGKTATITGLVLMPGSTYNVTFDSTAFDTASYKAFGLYDTTAWVFSTVMPIVTVTSLSEDFDAACQSNMLPNGWRKFNITGSQQWNCVNVNGGASMEISGYETNSNFANEDWLITPRIQPNSATTLFRYSIWKRFTGANPELLMSTSWDGMSTPGTATWTPMNISPLAANDSIWHQQSSTLPTPASNFYIAFKYTSTATEGIQLRIDSLTLIQYNVGVKNTTATSLPLLVVGTPTPDNITVAFSASEASKLELTLSDAIGRIILRRTVQVAIGSQLISISDLSLPAGMYVVKLGNSSSFRVTKAVVK